MPQSAMLPSKMPPAMAYVVSAFAIYAMFKFHDVQIAPSLALLPFGVSTLKGDNAGVLSIHNTSTKANNMICERDHGL